MSDDDARRLWVAYGPAGAVGRVQERADRYTVTMSGATDPVGTYPSLEIAKNALAAHLRPGADRPEFREH